MNYNANSRQQDIILSPCDKPLIITAGAGTGKTTTLTDRFVHIYLKHNLKPDGILLLTFTNKAANEMKERVLQKTNFAFCERENLWIHTFHSFCSRILKEEASYLNMSPDFEPLDTAEQKMLFKKVYNELITFSGDFEQLEQDLQSIRTADYRSFYSDTLKIIDQLRDKLISPAQFRDYIGVNNSTSGSEVMKKILFFLYRRFDSIMNELELKDFPKLIFDVIGIFNKYPGILKKYRKKFKFIMIDEFQDTNHSQFELIRLLSDEKLSNVTIVGDSRQSIYQWRGADPSNLEWFKSNLDTAQKLSLTENYRSYGEILNFACNFISERYGESERLSAAKGMKGEPAIFLHENPDGDAEFVAEEIKKMIIEKKYKPDDIVILLRKIKNKVLPYENALSCAGIPYYTIGAGAFFDKDEIKDIISYIRIVHDPFDMEALCRLLMRYPVYMSESELYEIKIKSKANSIAFFEQALLLPKSNEFCQSVLELASIKDNIGLVELFYRIYNKFNLGETFFANPVEFTNKKENINKLIDIMHAFSFKHPGCDIKDFIEYFELAAQDAEDDAELEKVQAQNCVRIMTLHKAKGLEFPVVFLSGLDILKVPKNSFMPSFALNSDYELIFKNSSGYSSYRETKLKNELDELYRLYYVGITRAKEKLYLTGKKLDSFRPSVSAMPACQWSDTTQINQPVDYSEYVEQEFDKQVFLKELGCIKNNFTNTGTVALSKKRRISLTCSSLHEFTECPYKYYLANILKYPVQEGESEIRWDRIGTVTHSIIEDYHKLNNKYTIDEIAQLKNSAEENIREDIVAGCVEFYKTTDYFLDSSDDFISEYPFCIKIDNIELKGQIDRFYLNDGLCRIVDFKTGFKGDSAKYRFQLELYAIALAKLFGVTQIRAELVFLSQKKIEILNLNSSDLLNAESLLKQIAREIENGNFVHNKSRLCQYCRYKYMPECEWDKKEYGCYGADSYYLKFYELLNLEEQECLNQIDAEPIPIKFKQVTEHKERYSVVTYFVEPYFLKLRQGDFVKLKGENNISVTAQIVDMDKNLISFLVNEVSNWNEFNSFIPYSDPIIYSRMKDNLLEFYKSESYLKRIILENTLPRLENKFCLNSGSGLDCYQLNAVKKTIDSEDMLIIHGPPGTGKTLTIAHIVKTLIEKGDRVLVCAYTNRALDAILIKVCDLVRESGFMELAQIARIGRMPMVHKSLVDNSVMLDEGLSRDCMAVEIGSKTVVGVTSAGIYPGLFDTVFDCAVIDEASQMPEPYAIGIVNCAKKLVMVGDDKQLAPVIQSSKALYGGLGVSLFERMKIYFEKNNADSIAMLKNQYRMNRKLIEFPSKMFYNGEVKTGNETVGMRKPPIRITNNKIPNWIESVINPDEPLIFVNLKETGDKYSGIACIADIVLKGLLDSAVKPEDIGIISPYRHEVSHLRKVLRINNLDIDTIDRFQGSDKEIIILSCAMKDSDIPDLLTNPNRFNVALTRSKSKLIVIGNLIFAENIKGTYFAKFIEFINRSGKTVVLRKCELDT